MSFCGPWNSVVGVRTISWMLSRDFQDELCYSGRPGAALVAHTWQEDLLVLTSSRREVLGVVGSRFYASADRGV